jgi:hypothetical protein
MTPLCSHRKSGNAGRSWKPVPQQQFYERYVQLNGQIFSTSYGISNLGQTAGYVQAEIEAPFREKLTECSTISDGGKLGSI